MVSHLAYLPMYFLMGMGLGVLAPVRDALALVL